MSFYYLLESCYKPYFLTKSCRTIEFTGRGRTAFKHRRMKLVEKHASPALRCNDLSTVPSISVIHSKIPLTFDTVIRRGLRSAVIKVINDTTRRLRNERVMFECTLTRSVNGGEEPHFILQFIASWIAHTIKTDAVKKCLVLFEAFG